MPASLVLEIPRRKVESSVVPSDLVVQPSYASTVSGSIPIYPE